jgi:hypothetical protein
MRRACVVMAVVAAVFFGLVGTSRADQPNKFPFGAGGSFTNPCNGDPLTFSVAGTGLALSSRGVFLLTEHGLGTGADTATGQTYGVTFDLVSTSAQDGSGSFTGHVTLGFVGTSGTTFVVHSVANVNFRPNQPEIVEIQFASCAGGGQTSLNAGATPPGAAPSMA